MSIRRVSVRYDKAEDEFIMRCDACAAAGKQKAWWPISLEFWEPRSGLQKCRACLNLAKRLARRKTAEEKRAAQRAYYYAHRDHRLAWRKAYYAEHSERINEARRARYAEKKAQEAHAQTLWELSADG